QCRDAGLILAERGAPPSGLDIESHQRAVYRLLERIDLEESQGGLHGGIDRSGGPLMREQRRQRPERHLAQPLAVAEEPVVERLLLHRETLEEITLIQSGRFAERRRRSLGRPSLELAHVDRDRAR